MALGLIQIVAPADEPVQVPEAKAFARVDNPDSDPLLKALIKAARTYVENRTGLQLVTATWQAYFDRFPRYSQLGGLQYASEVLWSQRIPQTELAGRYWPDRASFKMPRPPLQAVTSIQYVDGSTGQPLILDPALYLVDTVTRPGRLAPVPGSIWPIIKQQLNSVVITFQAGFGAPAQVPETLKLAIKMLVAHWHENREAAQQGPLTNIPNGVDALLASEWTGEWF